MSQKDDKEVRGISEVYIRITCKKYEPGQRSPYILQSPVTSSLCGPNILLTTFFLKHSLCSSLNVRDYVSHPYRTTGKIIVMHILIFIFLDSRREDNRFWTEW
jgi:uncharacterized membrane protein